LNVIGVEQYEGILPKLVATCMLHMDVKLRARMFDMKEQPQSAKGNQVEERIDQIPEIIKEFIFKEPITIEFLANQLKISRRHLLRKIYERYDMTAINLITNVKMGICHEMLQSNQYSIDEVCSLLGFKSPYYFKKKYEKYLKTMADNPITN
jgi:AraC-like DNA-binding protein